MDSLREKIFISFSSHIYKCRQLDILPLSYRFKVTDLVLFHKLVYNLIPLTMPEYLTIYDGSTPLRAIHLDSLSYVPSIDYKASGINNLNRSFFFRCHSLWNSLPLEIKTSHKPTEFNTNLIKYFWSQILTSNIDTDESDLSSEEND